MRVKHLDHLNLTVRDLAETVDFYGRLFGFEVVESGVYEGAPWAILRSGDAMLCCYEHAEFEVVRPRIASIHGMNHLALRIVDREAWEAVVAVEKPELLYGGVTRWPHSTAWYVADPSGYEIEVALWNDDTVRFGRVA
jgi:catechol 2,3-dioxygenase-like lactoylglutathione lyase family enzyme